MYARPPTPEEVDVLAEEAQRAVVDHADNEYASGVFDVLSWLSGTGERPDLETQPPARTPTRQQRGRRR